MEGDVLAVMDEWGPEKVVCVQDARTGMRGVLVIDNTSRGMGKGGTRMSTGVTVGEIARLARTMTWKWAANDLYFGGAKAGILGDPHGADKEAQLRAFARALANEVPKEYVFGLDMGLNERDAAIMADELGDIGAAVGLPGSLGGLPYDEFGLTGFGVAEATDAAASELGFELVGSRVAIQGYGAVGFAAAERLSELGASVTAISTISGAVVDPDGIDLKLLAALRVEHGDDCVLAYGGSPVPESVFGADVDILIPAAREDVITASIAASTTARLVVEAANMPTFPEARETLFERGIAVVPDFIANAGGIVAAAHSMNARRSPFAVDPEVVFDAVSSKMRANATSVVAESRRRAQPAHVTATGLAQERVASAMVARGQRDPRA